MTKVQVFRVPAPSQSVCASRKHSRSISTNATPRNLKSQLADTPIHTLLDHVATKSTAVLLAGLLLASPGPAFADDIPTANGLTS